MIKPGSGSPTPNAGGASGLGSKGIRGVAPRGGGNVRPGTYAGPGGGSVSVRPSAGGTSIRPSSYWGGNSSYYHAPYHHNYVPYYTSYSHCSPWRFGYYGSLFSFSFGGWFRPYGYYYNHYGNYRNSFWSPFDYSYCFPSYYSLNYVTQTYDAPVSDTLPASNSEPALQSAPQLAVHAPEQKPLDSAADRFLTLGDAAFGEGRFTDAVQLYAKAVEFAPEEASLYLVLGDALFASGDYHYAAYVIRKGLELDPSLASSVVDKHDFYANPAVLDQQLAVLESYLIRHPSDRDARLVLALNFLFAKRPAAAVDLLEVPEASGLADDTAGALILQAARSIQHGAPRD